jgi:hypothetical protein
MPGCLRVAIPPRFNSVEDAELKLPELFEYSMKYDDVENLWHLFGKIVVGGKILDYHTCEYSKIRAIAYYYSVIPNLMVVH